MAYNLVNEVKLVYKTTTKHNVFIGSSSDCVDVFRAHFDDDTIDYVESFYVLLLSQSSEVLGIKKIAEGGMTSCVVDVRTIFQTALLSRATSIILCHNHPSGSLKPSAEDKNITKKIKEGGKFLDIRVLDHIILTRDSYYSFADEFDM